MPQAGLKRTELLAAAAMACLLVVAFWWTGARMYLRWTQENSYYSHGFLIPVVSVILLYLKRKKLAACPRRPCAWGMLLLIPSLFVQVTSSAWQVGFLSGFALLGVLAGLTLTLFGWQVFRIVLFPLVFLAFMVPLPEVLIQKISNRMTLMAAKPATTLVDWLGVPAISVGNRIFLFQEEMVGSGVLGRGMGRPAGELVVDDVCSGLKYLISLMAFAALYAHISTVKWWGKWLLFVLSIPVAFVANVGRVTLMILVAHAVDVQATQEWYFHDLFGFVLFIIAFILLFVVEAMLIGEFRFGRRKASGSDEDQPPDEAAPAGTDVVRPSARFQGMLLSVVAVAAVLSAFLAWPRGTAPATDTLKNIPLVLGEWHGTEHPIDPRVLKILGTEDAMSRTYRNTRGEQVQLLVVIAQQARRRTHPPEQCFMGEGYDITGETDRRITVSLPSGPRTLPVRELILQPEGGSQKISWYFFKSGARVTTSYWGHQASLALHKLSEPNAADILVRVDRTVPNQDLEGCRDTLKRFLEAAAPELFNRLP